MWPSRCWMICRTADLSGDLMNSRFCYLVRLCGGLKTISGMFLPMVSSFPIQLQSLASQLIVSGLCCWMSTSNSQLEELSFSSWWIFLQSVIDVPVQWFCPFPSLFVPVQATQSQDGLRWWWKSSSRSLHSPAYSYVGFPRARLYGYALTWTRGACSWSWM